MKDCFVIMPIGSGESYEIYLNRYKNIIRPAIEKLKEGKEKFFRSIRADFISESGSITRSVIEHIYRSDAVIADLTDLNPNVFYELGVRHALRKGTVLLALYGTKIPFDIGDLKVVFYKDRVGGELEAIPQIQTFLKKILKDSPNDSPIFTTLPELCTEDQRDISEIKAKLDSAQSEVIELRTKLAVAEEVNLNLRKTFSSFEDYIQAKIESKTIAGAKITEEELRNALQQREQIAISPHFRISGTEEIPNTCFVLMPFREEFNEIYGLIRNVFKKLDIKSLRADELAFTGLITDQIADQIARSEFVLADVTGQNPNVMYEVGIAQTLGKQVILISQKGQRIPFDISTHRFLLYDMTPSGFKKFMYELEIFIKQIKENKQV